MKAYKGCGGLAVFVTSTLHGVFFQAFSTLASILLKKYLINADRHMTFGMV
jgi:hypothetical protein